jgi:hypothetical protein
MMGVGDKPESDKCNGGFTFNRELGTCEIHLEFNTPNMVWCDVAEDNPKLITCGYDLQRQEPE